MPPPLEIMLIVYKTKTSSLNNYSIVMLRVRYFTIYFITVFFQGLRMVILWGFFLKKIR